MNAVDYVRLEEELREGRNLFEGAFEDAAIGMALLAFDGRWLVVNRSFCEVLGYTLEELLELSFEEITHPEDLAADLGQVGGCSRTSSATTKWRNVTSTRRDTQSGCC
jgi:PAS domain S-box-containing protein